MKPMVPNAPVLLTEKGSDSAPPTRLSSQDRKGTEKG
jgi:hypothetical protein